MYVELVNATAASARVQLDVTGAKSLASTATAVTLAADPQATNAIGAPRAVVPVASKVSGVKLGFTSEVPAHAIVVLMIETH